VQEAYKSLDKEVDLSTKNVICLETEKLKMINYPENMLYVPELNQQEIINFYADKTPEQLDELIPKDVEESEQIIGKSWISNTGCRLSVQSTQ
jgi:hypothetical protein